MPGLRHRTDLLRTVQNTGYSFRRQCRTVQPSKRCNRSRWVPQLCWLLSTAPRCRAQSTGWTFDHSHRTGQQHRDCMAPGQFEPCTCPRRTADTAATTRAQHARVKHIRRYSHTLGTTYRASRTSVAAFARRRRGSGLAFDPVGVSQQATRHPHHRSPGEQGSTHDHSTQLSRGLAGTDDRSSTSTCAPAPHSR